MVAGHPHMGGPGRHQLEGAGHHPKGGVVRSGIAMATDLAEVLTEQFVGPVDQVHPH